MYTRIHCVSLSFEHKLCTFWYCRIALKVVSKRNHQIWVQCQRSIYRTIFTTYIFYASWFLNLNKNSNIISLFTVQKKTIYSLYRSSYVIIKFRSFLLFFLYNYENCLFKKNSSLLSYKIIPLKQFTWTQTWLCPIDFFVAIWRFFFFCKINFLHKLRIISFINKTTQKTQQGHCKN